LLFMGVAPVHDKGRPIETLCEELRVGIDLERSGHGAMPVGEHPVCGDDGIALNANRLSHAMIPALHGHRHGSISPTLS
jgi:hypothetical protein